MMDLYQTITDRIIEQLEIGTVPWKRPWIFVKNKCAFNRVTGRQYSLLNQMMLKHTGEYATFAQWEAAGGKIKPGEKSEIIVFWKKLEDDNIENESDTKPNEIVKPRFVLRYYRVFHISQVDRVKPLEKEEVVYQIDRHEKADGYVDSYIKREGIVLEESESNEAYYNAVRDLVHLPSVNQFNSVDDYYSTLFHELIHSTGHESRLAREGLLSPCFGSEEYSKEELIAEIGSAAILNMIGIETQQSFCNSVAYIENWLNVLKKDKRMIVLASSAAERAANYILANSVNA